MEKRYWIHSVTPVHVGSGRGIGYIDLPIAREKVTDWPYIPGSSIKGVIADHFGATEEDRKKEDAAPEKIAAFGAAGDDAALAGALVFSDANILCLPIRSFYGTFAWATSPFCLERHGMSTLLEEPPALYEAVVPENSLLAGGTTKMYLEDLDLDVKVSPAAGNLAGEIRASVFAGKEAWQRMFAGRFVIVHDDMFTFLCKSGTEVNARIKIDPATGTASDGALWYEEALPVETILSGRVWCDRVYGGKFKADELVRAFCSEPLTLQIGGKASTGKGLVRCIFEDGE